MDFTTSITFVSNEVGLDLVEELINDNYLDEYVVSYDYQNSPEPHMLTLRVETGEDYAMDIYNIQDKFINVFIDKDIDAIVDIIFAITDTKSFIDVVSTSEMYDARVDDDLDMVESLCTQYCLPFFGYDVDDEYTYDEDYDDDNEYNYN